jgi:hypothetical protein
MVQGTSIKVIIWPTILRVILIILLLIVTYFTWGTTIDFINNWLGYRLPDGFFGYSFADWGLALNLALIFWGGIIFSALGRVVDYLFIFLLIAFGVWGWSGTENITLIMWSSFIGIIVLSNLIGFGLKLLRQKFLPQVKV